MSLILVLFLILPGSSVAADPGSISGADSVSDLERLLRDRLALEEQHQRERTAWDAERRTLTATIEQRSARLEEARAWRESVARRVADGSAEIRRRELEIQAFGWREDAWRVWIDTAAEALAEQIAGLPLVDQGDGASRIRAASAATEQPLGDTAERFWSALLSVAGQGLESRLSTRRLLVDGEERDADVLFVGGSAAVFVTRDGAVCGVAVPEGSGIEWCRIEEPNCRAIRHAFRIARDEGPAELVTIPVPRQRVPGEVP